VILLLQDTSAVTVWDPVLGEKVEQRQFTPEDEKQAVLMEMYTDSRLEQYLRDLIEVADDPSWTGSRSPPVRLDATVRNPMLVCALPSLLLLVTGFFCAVSVRIPLHHSFEQTMLHS
jgi:hypothetical protein